APAKERNSPKKLAVSGTAILARQKMKNRGERLEVLGVPRIRVGILLFAGVEPTGTCPHLEQQIRTIERLVLPLNRLMLIVEIINNL
ncbi:17656_t:CDS:2, partial [Rhizophagus irregularis]